VGADFAQWGVHPCQTVALRPKAQSRWRWSRGRQFVPVEIKFAPTHVGGYNPGEVFVFFVLFAANESVFIRG
jgi:hypothetical protein